MKATREQIIETGFILVRDLNEEMYNENSLKIEKREIIIPTPEGKKYIKKDGWLFMVDSEKLYGDEAMRYWIEFLDNGSPYSIESLLSDDNPRSRYTIKDNTGKYKWVSREDYFKHHNFDFSNAIEEGQ